MDAAAAKSMRLTLPARSEMIVLLVCVAVVISIRLHLLIWTDFPINDGALFLVFIENIARTFPALPDFVGYNGFSIPFAYPPLSFWFSAAAVRLGVEPLALVHRLPILMNIGFVLLFVALLRRTGHSRLFTAVAVLVFGTTFRSYEWLVMGGGLSRGFGSLFLMATLLTLMSREREEPGTFSLQRLIFGGACVGAAMLSHLEWGMLAAISALVCLAVPRPAFKVYVGTSLVVGLTALALVLPWFLAVYGTHGLEPFVAASKTGSWRWGVFGDAARVLLKTSTYLLPFVLLGALAAARTRNVFWLLFMAVALIMIPRSGPTPMVLSLGVLAAMGFFSVLLLIQHLSLGVRRPAAAALVGIGVALTGLRAVDAMARDENFAPLSREHRGAMHWVAQNHPNSRFAIVKEATWTYDGASEWFPVLARAVNVTTVQGREWLPNEDFGRAYEAVEEQLHRSTSCEMVMRSLDAFRPIGFVWVEGVDLGARARSLQAERRRKTVQERLESAALGLKAAPLRYRGSDRRALRGPGTIGGCFDQAGYTEVHANDRVRIFRVPPEGTAAPVKEELRAPQASR